MIGALVRQFWAVATADWGDRLLRDRFARLGDSNALYGRAE